ncbi:XRE family transcriptional regulator [Pseudoxanthomonas sp. CF125]|uniref:helix-turn-helix domain-containing protein n=1 Tax=Pseudoxanthomonas sp. CF125 TaxID=1855303 RepID=UPI00088A3ECE|nr:XRE family transcriptional regulator [Pseudoxanthomonas sp. CF125]SDQ75641.1 Zn-dependent peptidase ImmA, M78 family [Pseudoxanthomonas sp. CF125]
MTMTQILRKKLDSPFIGEQLRLARHYWGRTLNEVAEQIGTSRQYVSQLESGKANPQRGDAVVDMLAQYLCVNEAFFFDRAYRPVAEEQAHFRKLASTKASSKHKVLARAAVLDRVIAFVETRVRLPTIDFPDLSSIHHAEGPEAAAQMLRERWGLGNGPIANMVRVVERAGAVVAFFRDASAEVDALSFVGKRPVVIRNEAKISPFRMRFDIAHELGHLILHEGHVTGDHKSEKEANQFASAFLMPAVAFKSMFKLRGDRIDWSVIREIKLKFLVSKAAVLYRAKSLGLLDELRYKSAVIALRNKGEKLEEAEDRWQEMEKAEVLGQALKVIRDSHSMPVDALISRLNVSLDFLAEVFPMPAWEPVPPVGGPIRLISSHGVVVDDR